MTFNHKINGDLIGIGGDAFYSNDPSIEGNPLLQWAGRGFIGEGSTFEGNTRGNNTNTSAWIHSGDTGNDVPSGQAAGSRLHWVQTLARFGVVDDGRVAIAGASSSRVPGNPVGVAGVGKLDISNSGYTAKGGYSEGVRGIGTNGAGKVFGHHASAMSFITAATAENRQGVTPFNAAWTGQTIAQYIEAGGGNTNATTADNPLLVGKEGATFWRGMTFQDGSITGVSDGSLSYGVEALLLPEDYNLSWYGRGDGKQTYRMYSTVTTRDAWQETVVSEAGWAHKRINSSGSATTLFGVRFVDNTVNTIWMNPSISGEAVKIEAAGGDATIDLELSPKGNGLLKFGTYDAEPMDLPIVGSLEFKTADGVTHKIALLK